MNPSDCPFCRQLADLAALRPAVVRSPVVWPFPHSVALLGTWQFYHGYCVLICRRHATELSRLPDDVRRGYLDELCLLARAIEKTFRPAKLNYELLGNQVPHLHWHIFPRYADDPDARRPVWFTLDRAETDAALRRSLEAGRQPPETTTAALQQALTRMAAPRA
jgi:diadenosine tetraphosphate (Ap4A) HIT family hydrolase